MTPEAEKAIAREAAERATKEANLSNEVKNLKDEVTNLKDWRINFEESFKKAIFRVFIAIWGGVIYFGSLVIEKLTAGWWPK